MKFIGNILWLIFGGLLVALGYFLVGLLFCITIIGLPFGLQLMKFALFSLWPFGTEVKDDTNSGGCLSIVMNILWLLLGWWEIAAAHVVFGIICCVTVIGIPFGVQHFKIAILSLAPFGKTFS
ncbi:MAG: YccF domain-containing protein [Bacteroidales bacterium]|nr:YccF domain-containing protein [Bacteroidales bacterium]